MQSPCDPLIKDHTEIFYIIYKWNVPSIQCKERLWGSNSMREVDCLNLVFIDFYVPALTPRLDCIKTALQLSENIALLALCLIQTGVISKEGNESPKSRAVNILSRPSLGLSNGIFLRAFRPEFRINFLSNPFVLHNPPDHPPWFRYYKNIW
jgi:hypothetical protein